jgi:hypothetical protein
MKMKIKKMIKSKIKSKIRICMNHGSCYRVGS